MMPLYEKQRKENARRYSILVKRQSCYKFTQFSILKAGAPDCQSITLFFSKKINLLID
jgi:hypothetical protein